MWKNDILSNFSNSPSPVSFIPHYYQAGTQFPVGFMLGKVKNFQSPQCFIFCSFDIIKYTSSYANTFCHYFCFINNQILLDRTLSFTIKFLISTFVLNLNYKYSKSNNKVNENLTRFLKISISLCDVRFCFRHHILKLKIHLIFECLAAFFRAKVLHCYYSVHEQFDSDQRVNVTRWSFLWGESAL